MRNSEENNNSSIEIPERSKKRISDNSLLNEKIGKKEFLKKFVNLFINLSI